MAKDGLKPAVLRWSHSAILGIASGGGDSPAALFYWAARFSTASLNLLKRRVRRPAVRYIATLLNRANPVRARRCPRSGKVVASCPSGLSSLHDMHVAGDEPSRRRSDSAGSSCRVVAYGDVPFLTGYKPMSLCRTCRRGYGDAGQSRLRVGFSELRPLWWRNGQSLHSVARTRRRRHRCRPVSFRLVDPPFSGDGAGREDHSAQSEVVCPSVTMRTTLIGAERHAVVARQGCGHWG